MKPAGYSLGLILVTASAIAWSTAGLFTRIIPLDSWTMLAWRDIFGALGIAAVIFALKRRDAWEEFRRMDWPSWLFAIVSALGMIFFITSLKHTLWVWLVFSETPGSGTITGGLIVFVAVAAHLAANAIKMNRPGPAPIVPAP